MTVLFNGAILDKFAATDENIVREWHVTPAANGAPNVLELSTDETYNAVQRHEGDARIRREVQVAWHRPYGEALDQRHRRRVVHIHLIARQAVDHQEPAVGA